MMEAIKLHVREACNSAHAQAASKAFQQYFTDNPRPLIYISLIVTTFIWASVLIIRRFKSGKAPARSRSPDLEKPSKFKVDRPPGGEFIFEENKSWRKIEEGGNGNIDNKRGKIMQYIQIEETY